MPRWVNLESLVRVLVELQPTGKADPDAEVRRILILWRVADGDQLLHDKSPAPLAAEMTSAPEKTVNDEETAHGEPDVDGTNVEPMARSSASKPLIRWYPRQRTLDVFDRKMAAEIFKRVGGIDEQP